jgi:hypothetical protein
VLSQRSRRPFRHWSGTGRMPPSPCTGSIRIAAVRSVTAAFSASWSPQGTWTKPGRSGPKPLVIFSDPAAAMAAEERPWKEPSKVTISIRSGSPFSYQYLRTILTASSQASVPELVKNTVSAKVFSTSRSASSCCLGMR